MNPDDVAWEAGLAEVRDPLITAKKLAYLTDFYVDEALQNPALDLIVIEEPDFWIRLVPNARKQVARSPYCPESFAQWMLRQPFGRQDERVELALNPALPLALRRTVFLGWINADVHGLHERDPQLTALSAVASAEERRLLVAGVTGWPLDEAEFAQLAAIGKPGLTLMLKHPGCPPAQLVRYRRSGDDDETAWVLTHPNYPADLLAAELESPVRGVRFWAVRNPQLTHEQIQRAWDDGQGISLAQNPGLPAEWLERLVRSSDVLHRHSVAGHPKLTPAQQLVLAADEDPDVREELSENPSLTAEAKAALG